MIAGMKFPLRRLCGATLVLVTFAASAQSPNQGDLLVASVEMLDPSFAQSVLLVLRHDENGSLALIINRPTELAADETFPDVDALSGYRGRLFYGGPVLPTRLLLLVRNPPTELADSPRLVEDVHLSGDPELIGELGSWADDEAALRLFAGHAAWAPGQLEAEIEEGSWRIVQGRADLVFADRPLELWERISAFDAELVVEAWEN